jgi:hypothetical protein
MIETALQRLNYIIARVPDMLMQISEENMSAKPLSNKWSKKEILGHLIDSATHNHHRCIRGQFEDTPEISYDQSQWNKFGFYQEIDSMQIIQFFTIYNIQLIEIIKRMPSKNFSNQIKIADNVLTLETIVINYVDHLEHHLKQIFDY